MLALSYHFKLFFESATATISFDCKTFISSSFLQRKIAWYFLAQLFSWIKLTYCPDSYLKFCPWIQFAELFEFNVWLPPPWRRRESKNIVSWMVLIGNGISTEVPPSMISLPSCSLKGLRSIPKVFHLIPCCMMRRRVNIQFKKDSQIWNQPWQKFRVWIRGPGGYFWWKKWRSNILYYCPFKCHKER